MDEPPRSRSTIVCVCGSTRFRAEILEAVRSETMKGRIVLAPGVFSQAVGEQLDTGVIRRLTDLHAEKIRMADEVLVVDVGGRVGEATAHEAAYAASLGKPVRYWSKTTEDGARDAGAYCDRIPEATPGVAYVKVDGQREPVRVRAAYISDDDIDLTAAQYSAPSGPTGSFI